MHIYWVSETFPKHSRHQSVTMKSVPSPEQYHVTGAVRRSINLVSIIPQIRPALFHNFGQNFGHNNLASKLANCQFHNTSMIVLQQFHNSSTEVLGHYQVTIIVLNESHAQKIGQNYGIMLAKFRHRFTSKYCTT